MKRKNSRGFSLLEMLIVVAIGFTMAGITFIAFTPGLHENHVDQGYDTTLQALRGARNMAIEQGRRYIVIFTPPNTITVQLWAYGSPVSPPPVTVNTYTLPSGVQFSWQGGFPLPGPDNNSAAAAVSFNNCIVTGGMCVIFYPDGSSQDDIGNYNSGIVYMTDTSTTNIYTSRAVDLFGTTGRIRGWRLYNQSGANTWVQQ